MPARPIDRAEGAFTLIELLVVMIIISILMAVAVPTFLKQKQTAVATQAKANIKQVINTIESCVATNTDGAVNSTSPGGRNCTATGVLTADEPTMTNVLGNGIGKIAITPNGTMGYIVTATYAGENGNGTFVENHASNGVITKTCTPSGSKACPSGTW